MRRALVGTVLVVGMALAGCGGGTASTGAGATDAPASAGATTPATDPGSGTSTGCADLTKEEVARYALYAQVFPQVRSQSVIDSVRQGTITDYTPEAFAATLAKMQFVRGHGVPGLGDPGASLDYYASVNDALASLLAQPDPVPQAAIDAYLTTVGSVAGSLSKQLPLNAALSELCPNL